jgi:hypothetical protein
VDAECFISCVADTLTVSVSVSEKCASLWLMGLLFEVTSIDFEEVVLNRCFDKMNYLSNRGWCVLTVFTSCCVVFIIDVTRNDIVHIGAVKRVHSIVVLGNFYFYHAIYKIRYKYVYSVGVSLSFRPAADLLCHLVRN